MSNIFTFIFIFAVIVSHSIEWWLARRQMLHIEAHRDEVPDAFKETISLEAHQKAADYTAAKDRLGRINSIILLILLFCLTLGGGVDWVTSLWSEYKLSPVIMGLAIILSVFFISHLVELPFSIYQTFKLEERFGFNRSTPRQFILDQAAGLVLSGLIGGMLLTLILWVMQTVGSLWWILAWAILISFSILMSWLYPILIAPLFNKFTPLEDERLKIRIQNLLERCGFNSKGIFVMDGSRRSGHGNAYFTGIGSNKRIVFFDTLVNSLEHEELEAVLAHELGHFKLKHVMKMLVATSILSLMGFALLGWLVGQSWFYSGLGISEPSNAAALLLFILISPVFSTFLQPITAYYQRKHEFEADNYASNIAKPSALISALVKLYRDNANTLTPDPVYSAFHYSHPPAAIRIANLSDKMNSSRS